MNETIQPISWSHELIENADESYTVSFKADIEGNWVLYSQHTSPGGPVATSFNFEENACFVLNGEVEEQSKAIKEQCPLFEMEVIKFKKESIFTQNFTKSCSGKLEATVRFMTCDGERCLAPTEHSFEIIIP